MAELTIRSEDIRDALTRFVSDYKPEAASTEEVGTVAEAGDGIAASRDCRRRWPTSC